MAAMLIALIQRRSEMKAQDELLLVQLWKFRKGVLDNIAREMDNAGASEEDISSVTHNLETRWIIADRREKASK